MFRRHCNLRSVTFHAPDFFAAILMLTTLDRVMHRPELFRLREVSPLWILSVNFGDFAIRPNTDLLSSDIICQFILFPAGGPEERGEGSKSS
jgi:hypothetical protein